MRARASPLLIYTCPTASEEWDGGTEHHGGQKNERKKKKQERRGRHCEHACPFSKPQKKKEAPLTKIEDKIQSGTSGRHKEPQFSGKKRARRKNMLRLRRHLKKKEDAEAQDKVQGAFGERRQNLDPRRTLRHRYGWLLYTPQNAFRCCDRQVGRSARSNLVAFADFLSR